MYSTLPKTSEEFAQLSWSTVKPWYQELLTTDLTSQTLDTWMAQWSHLEALHDETVALLEIATFTNTADEERSKRRQRFLEDIDNPIQTYEQQLKQKLLMSKLVPQGFAVPLRNLQVDVELYREENLALLNEETRWSEKYMAIRGSRTYLWEGKEVTAAELTPYFVDPDRSLREKAWRVSAQRKVQDDAAVNDVWIKSFELRRRIAANAGLPSFREYRWKQLHRFDYTPETNKAFAAAVEEVIVPIAAQIMEKRRQMLNLDTIRPWDGAVDPRSDKAPRRVTNEDIPEVLRKSAATFRLVDPILGQHFDTMIAENCFDLDRRPNKAPGGYNYPLMVKNRPFIFGQVSTIEQSVYVIFHEGGHAFHVFEASGLPYVQQRNLTAVPIEFAEVASTSMEWIGGMHTTESGIYNEDEARRENLKKYERFFVMLADVMSVDAFQQWAYENPDLAVQPDVLAAKWLELTRRYMPWIDISGLEDLVAHGWHSYLHIFKVPFYVIEYAYALLGSVQVWRNYLKDPHKAISDYRHALSLGATLPLPKLYETAGATFEATPEILRELSTLVLEHMNKLERE